MIESGNGGTHDGQVVRIYYQNFEPCTDAKLFERAASEGGFHQPLARGLRCSRNAHLGNVIRFGAFLSQIQDGQEIWLATDIQDVDGASTAETNQVF
jgi:hypothetical protein